MKVRSKLIIGFVAVSMTTAIVGGIGWWGMNQSSNSITRLGRENVPSILSLETIKSSLLEIKVVIRTLMDINVNKEEFQRQFDNLAKSRITYGKSINDYDSSRKTKEEENFWKVFSTDLDDLKKADNIFFEYIKTQADKGTDFHKIQNDIEARGFAAKPPFDKAMGSFQNLMDYVNNYYGKEQIDRTVASTMMISSTMLIVLLLSIAVAIILAASFGNMLTKPLSKMEKGLKSMADGDLQIKLNSESNDEFGKISESYNTVRDSLMNMVSDTEMLTKAAIEGQLAKRADSSRHQGDFKKIVDGVNKTLDSVIGPLNVTAKYIDDISRGEIPPVITDNFYGDFNIIKNNLNTCIGAINKMVEDANILVQAGMEGRLDTRADTSKHQGDFKKIVDGVNRTLDSVINPINETISVLKKMSEGDMTDGMKGDYKGDFNVLKNALNSTLSSINEILTQVNSAVEQVSSGSTQVSQASQSLSQGATEQASSLEEITSSITEISSQTKLNTENSITVNGLARTAKENAEQGNNQMADLVKAMSSINVSAESIKKIVKAIDDIAFQINLLALNANVEAARAGKYGKGFAVVADEVRNLAVRSATSVKETTQMVEETIKNIDNGNSLVTVTSKQLAEIVKGASKVADLAEEVATASKEQSQGLEQISTGLGQIDEVTQSNTASAEESASASEELASQAQQLKAMITKFKLKAVEGAGKITEISPDMMQMIRNELSKDQAQKHLAGRISQTPAGAPLEKILAHAGINPRQVISLDDDNFGKF